MEQPVFIWEIGDVARALLAVAIIVPFVYWSVKYFPIDPTSYGAVIPVMIVFGTCCGVWVVVTKVSNPRSREYAMQMEESKDKTDTT